MSITCRDQPSCTVYFEPWGSEHALTSGEALHLTGSDIEDVYLVEGGIVVWFRAADPEILDDAGRRIPT